VIVAEFVTGVLSDPKINYTRGGMFPIDNAALQKLGTLLLDQLSFMAGGSGKDQSAELKKMHAGIKFTPGESILMLEHLSAAMAKAKLSPQDRTELGKKALDLRSQLASDK
jgi:truncated hemoglobin YjbI